MRINREKIKSYAETAWKYYVRWSYVKRHLTLFSMYIGVVGAVTFGVSGIRASIKSDPDGATSFGWQGDRSVTPV